MSNEMVTRYCIVCEGDTRFIHTAREEFIICSQCHFRRKFKKNKSDYKEEYSWKNK